MLGCSHTGRHCWLSLPRARFPTGAAAVDAPPHEDSGKMVGLCGDEICRVPHDEVVGERRPLALDVYKSAEVLSALPD
jgi:hypothetical protein